MDPYVYPGTNVLRNLREIRDPDRLAMFEMDMATGRVSELLRRSIQGTFDRQHLQSIHNYIFQDVYAWAGEFRTVNISRPGQFPFAFSHLIAHNINELLNALEKERHLADLGRPMFAKRAAHYMAELNAIHPFRDGNGRAQREFIRELAVKNGYALDWSRVTREQMTEASKASFQRGDNSSLEEVLEAALVDERKGPRE